ncbi:MAG: PEP-CTERM system-associated, FemAB-related protein [Gammaproteobacteria bacterium]|nr:MAG: PEP-CTERM system-associated, FemAB-related protein [Gammaproteobacteria bacterium]
MINIKLATINDQKAWDQYVIQHSDSTPYHHFAWLQSVQSAYKHKTLAWLAIDNNKKVVGVLPSVLIKPPLSSAKLSALPFCDVGGALTDTNEIKAELITTANNYCKKNNIKTFEHRQSVDTTQNTDETIKTTNKVRMLLQLPENSEILFAGFKSKLRSQIRKAEKNGLTSTVGRDQKHIDGFYQVFARNMRDLGSPVHSKKWFEDILANYQNNIIISNIYKDNIVVGAGIVLFNGENCSIPWASTNADHNRLAPNMLLYWSLLAYATDNGCKSFDFGRSTIGEGTYKFKKQWGTEPLALNWESYSNGAILPEDLTTSTGKLRVYVEAVWKKLPVFLSITLGTKIRKYISL